jgi:hypothetical protein
MSEREVLVERANYFAEARALAHRLEQRSQREPPQWNPPTGDPDVDALCWFRYVHTDVLPHAAE